MFKEIIKSEKATSIRGVLGDYFRIKAKKYKSYKRTAERFQTDDFDVIIYGNRWYIESNIYHQRIPKSVFKHIDVLLRKDGCTYLYN